MLKGYAVGRKTTNKIEGLDEIDKFDIMTNFKYYKVPTPEIIVMDNSRNKISSYNGPLFDAIVCDPPYGVRARS